MKRALRPGRRTRILAILLLGLMGVFVARLFYLQIIRHQYYVDAAAQEQVKRNDIPARRGLIYAMSGAAPVELVMNEPVYTVFADPSVIGNGSKVLDAVEKIAGGNMQPKAAVLLKDTTSRYAVLATKLTYDQAQKLKSQHLAGVGFQENTQRVYPEGGLAAQTLGFVNSSGDGQYGVEQALNSQLKGKDGLLKSVADVSGVPLTIGNDNIDRPAVNGTNIALTIDRNVQSYVEQALANGLAKSHAPNGSAIVMDPQTGKILAMANLPSYDPANYGNATDANVFQNNVLSAPYEAGSVVKSLTVAMGINQGVITPSSTYENKGMIDVDGTTIKNASTTESLGTTTMQTALTDSLNTGMVTIAERMGDGSNITKNARTTIYDYFHNRFGFGQLTGVESAGESPGIIISPDDVQGNAVRYSNMVFGQGMNITMVQMAAAFSSIINGGMYHAPTLLNGIVDDSGGLTPNTVKSSHQVVSAATSAQVKDMLQVDRKGNGAKDPAGYSVGGKTGTSQALINGQYSFTQTTGTYIGFGGTDAPRYVIMVQVSGPGLNLQGAANASPIFGDISNWMINYLNLHPQGQ